MSCFIPFATGNIQILFFSFRVGELDRLAGVSWSFPMTWMEKQMEEETTLLNVKNPQSVRHDLSSIESLHRCGLSEKSKAQMRRAKRMIQYLARRIQYRDSSLEDLVWGFWNKNFKIMGDSRWGLIPIWGTQHEETQKQYLQWALFWSVWNQRECKEYPLFWGWRTSTHKGHLQNFRF